MKYSPDAPYMKLKVTHAMNTVESQSSQTPNHLVEAKNMYHELVCKS